MNSYRENSYVARPTIWAWQLPLSDSDRDFIRLIQNEISKSP